MGLVADVFRSLRRAVTSRQLYVVHHQVGESRLYTLKLKLKQDKEGLFVSMNVDNENGYLEMSLNDLDAVIETMQMFRATAQKFQVSD